MQDPNYRFEFVGKEEWESTSELLSFTSSFNFQQRRLLSFYMLSF